MNNEVRTHKALHLVLCTGNAECFEQAKWRIALDLTHPREWLRDSGGDSAVYDQRHKSKEVPTSCVGTVRHDHNRGRYSDSGTCR